MFDVNSDGQIRTDKMASSCWSVPGSDKKFSSICRSGASGLWTSGLQVVRKKMLRYVWFKIWPMAIFLRDLYLGDYRPDGQGH